MINSLGRSYLLLEKDLTLLLILSSLYLAGLVYFMFKRLEEEFVKETDENKNIKLSVEGRKIRKINTRNKAVKKILVLLLPFIVMMLTTTALTRTHYITHQRHCYFDEQGYIISAMNFKETGFASLENKRLTLSIYDKDSSKRQPISNELPSLFKEVNFTHEGYFKIKDNEYSLFMFKMPTYILAISWLYYEGETYAGFNSKVKNFQVFIYLLNGLLIFFLSFIILQKINVGQTSINYFISILTQTIYYITPLIFVNSRETTPGIISTIAILTACLSAFLLINSTEYKNKKEHKKVNSNVLFYSVGTLLSLIVLVTSRAEYLSILPFFLIPYIILVKRGYIKEFLLSIPMLLLFSPAFINIVRFLSSQATSLKGANSGILPFSINNFSRTYFYYTMTSTVFIILLIVGAFYSLAYIILTKSQKKLRDNESLVYIFEMYLLILLTILAIYAFYFYKDSRFFVPILSLQMIFFALGFFVIFNTFNEVLKEIISRVEHKRKIKIRNSIISALLLTILIGGTVTSSSLQTESFMMRYIGDYKNTQFNTAGDFLNLLCNLNRNYIYIFAASYLGKIYHNLKFCHIEDYPTVSKLLSENQTVYMIKDVFGTLGMEKKYYLKNLTQKEKEKIFMNNKNCGNLTYNGQPLIDEFPIWKITGVKNS